MQRWPVVQRMCPESVLQVLTIDGGGASMRDEVLDGQGTVM